MKDRTFGLLMMAAGVLLISPDSLLVRLADDTAPTFTLLLWRNLFGCITQFVLTAAKLGGVRPMIGHMWQSGIFLILSMPIQACGTICLTLSFTKTSAANALVLFYLQPLWASIGSVIYFKDPLPRRTVVAVAIGLCAAVAVFFGTTLGDSDGGGETSVEGDVYGLVAGICYAVYFMVCRACAVARPGVEMLPAAAGGMALSVLVVLPLARDDLLTYTDDVFWLWVVLNGCIVLGVALLLMTSAMKFILPPENALIGLLELALGPLWVYVGLGEQPSIWTLGALVVLLITLGCHEYLGLRDAKNRKASEPDEGEGRDTPMVLNETPTDKKESGISEMPRVTHESIV
jgi:drug/metabolite transporter (DMT)-like permease